jgi:hypothetical protein
LHWEMVSCEPVGRSLTRLGEVLEPQAGSAIGEISPAASMAMIVRSL